QNSKIKNPSVPWNLYYRVTIEDAVLVGLAKVINSVQKTSATSEEFISDCRARARDEEIFQQSYLCNPFGAAANRIVDWSAIERCRYDYEIECVHLEENEILKQFGPFDPSAQTARQSEIELFVRDSFPTLFYLLGNLKNLHAAGDETGLGRQICWEAAKNYSSRFLKVNFTSKKHDLGFALMNQLSVAGKRFPKSGQDIAADYFALRKAHTG